MDNGTYVLDFVVNNCGTEKTIPITGVVCDDVLRFSIEHVCEPLDSTDTRINYDVGNFSARIEFNTEIFSEFNFIVL